MPLHVLTDTDVREVLESLTRQDVLVLHRSLADALHKYSTATDADMSSACADNQPQRIAVKCKNGSTTLFMPATSDAAIGVKIVTISEATGSNGDSSPDGFPLLSMADSRASSPSSTPTRSRTPNPHESSSPRQRKGPGSSTSSLSHHASSISSSTSLSSSTATTKEDTEPKMMTPGEPMEAIKPSATSPKGSITLLSPDGKPRALINASTLTAFRTALASTLLLKARHSVHTITVFGAGMQAYWHIYLSLLLRGTAIHHLHVVNRTFLSAQRLLMTLAQSNNPEMSDAFLAKNFRPSILTPEYGEYTRLLKTHVRDADVIFCCTPSTTPLFPAGHLTNPEGRRKARYVVAIGSYKPHMQELHEDVLRQAVKGPEGERHGKHHGLHIHHQTANEGGAVVVDSIEAAMKEAGEVIRAGIGGQGVVELGELVMLKRSHWAAKQEEEAKQRDHIEKKGQGDHKHGHGIAHLFHHSKDKDKGLHSPASPSPLVEHHSDGGLMDWLERGNVVYKSVGIGLMDVVVGLEIVRLAEERGIGTRVDDF